MKKSKANGELAPDNHSQALLVIDMINDFDFPGADKVLRDAKKAVAPLARLLVRARKAKIPIVYVNDNFGRWKSDFPAQVRYCLKDDCRGSVILRSILPTATDYHVLKPRHSGFYASPLALLLSEMGVRQLFLSGLTTESCVYMTAVDAHLRGLEIIVLSDCVASETPRLKNAALLMMRHCLRAKLQKSTDVRFAEGYDAGR